MVPDYASAPAVLDWLETELRGIGDEPRFTVENRTERRARIRRDRAELRAADRKSAK